MATRIIKKNLAGEEDILFGEGTVIQTRNDASYNINKVRTVRPVNSLVELNALDPVQFPKAVLFSGTTMTFYTYNVGGGVWEVTVEAVIKAVETSTNFDDITSDVNVVNKFLGKQVFNSTSTKPVYATGSADADVWVDATGATVHTPV